MSKLYYGKENYSIDLNNKSDANNFNKDFGAGVEHCSTSTGDNEELPEYPIPDDEDATVFPEPTKTGLPSQTIEEDMIGPDEAWD